MKNICTTFILMALIMIFTSPAKAQVFDLSSTKKKTVIANQEYPTVYKPSKLIIGSKTKFIIKAEPNSHVSLATSDENGGGIDLYGKKLRLGRLVNPYEGIVGEKGVLELEVPMPEEKELVGKVLYFEVLVWKNPDMSDLKVAKIMGIDGHETNINAVVITEPPKNPSLPGFGPNIPGAGGDVSRVKEIFNKINETDHDSSDNYYNGEMFYNNQPLMIRNLRTPQLKNKPEQKTGKDE